MSEKTVRHVISLLVTIVSMLIWWAGYYAGSKGWWLFFVPVLVMYAITYKLVDA